MKTTLTLALCLLVAVAQAQDKKVSVHYNKLIELKDTDYMIATVSEASKSASKNKHYLLFINTRSGASEEAILPHQSFNDRIEHIRLDTVGINLVLMSAKTIDLNRKNGIDWEDPTQIFVYSVDGKQRTQITDDRFFVSSWAVSSETGRVVITGHYDTNGNGKHDASDEPRIVLYDLKAMAAVPVTAAQ